MAATDPATVPCHDRDEPSAPMASTRLAAKYGRAVEIVAHRGASHDAPENTLPAIRLAWERDADAVEIDVRLTADGAIVAMHDTTVKRYTGIDRTASAFTLAELKGLDFGAWKGFRWAGTRIATVDEILPLTPDGRRLFIEIKCGTEIVPRLADRIRAAEIPACKAAFICFNGEVLRDIKRLLPEHQAYLLANLDKVDQQHSQDGALRTLADEARQAGLDGVDVHAERIGADTIRELQQGGMKVFAWTINEPVAADSLLRLGVDGITTDRPAWLRKKLLDE